MEAYAWSGWNVCMCVYGGKQSVDMYVYTCAHIHDIVSLS